MQMKDTIETAERVISMASAWQIPTPHYATPVHPEVTYMCSHCGLSVMQTEVIGGEAKCGRCA